MFRIKSVSLVSLFIMLGLGLVCPACATEKPVTPLWSVSPPDCFGTSPWPPTVGPDGRIYIDSGRWMFFAVSPAGVVEQTFGELGKINGHPAVSADGTMYVTTSKEDLYAYNPDGTVKWIFDVGRPMPAPVLGSDGTVYIGGMAVRALNLDGTVKWSYDVDGMTSTSPVTDADRIVIRYSESRIDTLNPDGSLAWSWEDVDRVVFGCGVGRDGSLCLQTADESYEDLRLQLLDPAGRELWARTIAGFLDSGPVVAADGAVYYHREDGFLQAVNPDGSDRWSFETGRTIVGQVAVSDAGVVYSPGSDGWLYAINPDGNLRWRYQGEQSWGTPSVAPDGIVYVVNSSDRKLYAFAP